MKLYTSLFFTVALVTLSYLNVSCGTNPGGASLNAVDLTSIPNASAMLAGTGANGIVRASHSYGIDLQSVSGTAPNLKDLTAANALTYFWNGIVATVNTAGTCSAGNKNKFWGQDTSTPGPGGQGACMMAQGTGEALSRMMDGTATLCYMKGIGSAASGVTASSGSAATAFSQGASDKVVKVAVTNMTQGGRPERVNMDVFFRVYGTNSVTSDKYKYLMWMCQSGSITNRETLEITKSTGLMSVDTSNNEGGGSRGNMAITAYLTNNNGTITFDKSRSRTALSKFTGSWGTYAGKVELTTGDLIKAWRYNYNSTWGYNKTYSVSAFAGTGVDDFRFLQGCFKGTSSPANLSTTWSYSGITEFRDTFYAAVASSDLSPQCDAFSFASDGLFNDVSVATLDTTDLDCSATPDITVTMDFSDAAVDAVKTTCDGDRRKLQNYSMCDSNAMRTAENLCRN